MSKLQVIAHYTIAPGNEDAVTETLPKLALASRNEPGNLYYSAFAELGEPRNIVILEQYDSPESFAAHLETDHFKEFGLGTIIPLLADRRVERFPID